MKLLEVEIRF